MAFELSKAPIKFKESHFASVSDLNWAWIYLDENGVWIQFECIICMILESRWQAWSLDPSLELKIYFDQIMFQINFQLMLAISLDKNQKDKRMHIKRTEKNTR